MKKSEFYGVTADENGELFYATLEELAYLAERNEDFAWKMEHDLQDDDYDD